jgi:hypothetical protein
MSDIENPWVGTANGRGAKGLFARGNTFATGNPANRRMRELRQALLDCATPEKVREVEASLHELAVGGDVHAARTWLEFCTGKPPQAVELAGPDGESLDLPSVVSTIMIALGDEPEARIKVAAAFHRLGRSRDGLPQLGSGS